MGIITFCQRIGMSKGGYYAMLEKKTLKLDVLEKIAEVLGVSVSTFFGEDEKLNATKESDAIYGNNDMIAVLKKISKQKDELLYCNVDLLHLKRVRMYLLANVGGNYKWISS